MKKRFKAFLLILAFAIVTFSKFNLTVVNAEYHKNYEAVYPPNCFVDFNNKKYLMKTVYKYRLKILNEYWQVGIEGFAVKKSIGNENPILKFRKSDLKIWYNSCEYKILETRKDTIIAKINDNEIILFVD